MWNQLKRWLQERGEHPRQRRTSPAHFRGQFESLETRSMLSASYANATADQVDVYVVAIFMHREPQLTVAAVYSETGYALYDSAPWESLSRPKPNGDWRGPIGLHGGGLQTSFGANYGAQLQVDGSGRIDDPISGFAEDRNLNTVVGGSKGVLPPGALSASAPGDDPATGIPTNSNKTITFVDPSKSRPPLPSGLAGTFATYYSSLTQSGISPAQSLTSLERADNVQEAVFGTYSPDSLLLAADSDAADEDNPRGLDGKLDVDEEDVADASDTPHSIFDEASDAALDALRRERHAIDAVLADLHEVELHSEDVSSHATQTHDPSNSTASKEQAHWHSDDAPAVTSQNAYEADGGMVLLEPAGDANSNAYDLTAVYLPGLNSDGDTPLAVEASVGIYQAIDVGASELRPSGRDNLPIAQPKSTVGPSVSAENAPAKKSEQPS